MATSEGRLPGPLDLGGNKAENWRRFQEDFTIYLASTEKEGKPDAVKIALMLNCAGRELVDIFNTLKFDTEEDKKKYKKVVEKLNEHFEPRVYVTYERYMFFTRAQNSDESIDKYVTDLKIKARNCKFGDLHDEMIRDRIVCGTNSEHLRARLLRQGDTSLDKVLELCRAHEASEAQMKDLSQSVRDISVNAVSVKKGKLPDSLRECKFCGFKHVFGKSNCPAAYKKCMSCGSLGHFKSKCGSVKSKEGKAEIKHKRKTVKQAYKDGSSSDSEEVEEKAVGQLKIMKLKKSNRENKCKLTDMDDVVSLKLQDITVQFQMDTGAQVSVLPKNVYDKLNPRPTLIKTSAVLVSFAGSKIKPIGKCSVYCLSNKIKYQLAFYVVDVKVSPLLSKNACKLLGLIKFVNEVKPTIHAADANGMLEEFSDVFEGLGCLDGTVKLQFDPSVTPVAHPPRKIPVALRDKLKKELDHMEKLGVIVKENKPTDWVNSMVVIDKDKKLRICLDPRDLNQALKRSHYPLPTIEEVSTRLAGAKMFSVLDATKGFWQLKVDETSSKLLTFNTCFGRYRYLRLPFGISPAPEIYQRRMHEVFDDLEGVEIIMDDILVHGRTEAEHDHRLKTVLQRCREANLKLNPNKIKLKTKQVEYIGHVLTENGIHTDQQKVTAVEKFPVPQNKTELQRFLGMINYLGKFIPNLSTITEPLRVLLEKDTDFSWEKRQHESFQKLKDLVARAPVLKYYDVSAPVLLSVDASSFALGACIMQEGHPVAYAARSLTKSEKNYAQIEKELLAIVFGVERFHSYLYGKDNIVVETDHKPLEAIFRKPLASTPLRLQRMLLRLQKYCIEVKYKKGTEMYVADALSRIEWPRDEGNKEKMFWEINSVAVCKLPEDKLMELKSATYKDASMQKLVEMITSGWPESRSQVPECIRAYWSFRHEISCHDGLLLKLDKIIIPRELRGKMLKEVHRAHQGVEKSLRFARDLLFWPGMTSEIKDIVSSCDTCNTYQMQQAKEPLMPHEVPELPWLKIGADLFEWDKKPYLLLVDYYSKYFEFNLLENTECKTVITYCKSQFSRHGIPQILHTDNGPQFVAKEFEHFCKAYGINHTSSSPYYPRSNGLAEKTIQTLKKILTKAKRDGCDPYLSVLDYRNTPVVGDASPAQLLFGRRTKTTLPTLSSLLVPHVQDPVDIKAKLKEKQETQKYYYDKVARPLSELEEGNVVRMRDDSKKGEWKKAVVVAPRSYIVQDTNGKMYRRNRQHLVRTRDNPMPVERQDARDLEELDYSSSNGCSTTMQRYASDQSHRIELQSQPEAISNLVDSARPESPEVRTRSGRLVQRPNKLDL